MEPLISVIVPIYNVEKYLQRAIESIIHQSYSNLEIILVDDGSPDRCGQICEEYAGRDARIKVIHKPNGGLSDARNAGLDCMSGQYVVFVDSDDYIAPYFIEELYRGICEEGADVSFCRYAVVCQEDMSEMEQKLHRPVADQQNGMDATDIYDTKELLLNMYDFNHQDATYFIVSWNKLYRAELWKTIRFPKGKIHEDEATTYKVFDKAQKGVYIKCPMYAYFSAPSSITRDAFSLKRLDWMDALSERIAYFEKKQQNQLVASGLRARADGSIKYFYPLRDTIKDSQTEQKKLKSYVKEALKANKKYQNLTKRNRLGYRIFLISPFVYRMILKG